MKIKKIGCVCAVAVCVAVIGIIAAALNPSLQTRIASSVLEGKFAGAKLQKLDAGISSYRWTDWSCRFRTAQRYR